MSEPRRNHRIRVVGFVMAAVLAVWALPAGADPNNNNSKKLRKAVTLAGVTEHLEAFQSIADDNGGTRFAGLGGHDDSAAYVADRMSAAGYVVTTQEFTYNAFFEVTPSELEQASPSPTTYVNGNDFRVMSYSGSGATTAPLAAPSGPATGATRGTSQDSLRATSLS